MSTISTHLNWGASYVVNDFYVRFLKPDSSDREQVLVGRIATVILMVIAGTMALTFLENATQAFNILLLSRSRHGSNFSFTLVLVENQCLDGSSSNDCRHA